MNRFNRGIRIGALRHQHVELIPKPLAGGREVEVVSLDGKTVYECDLAAGRVPRIAPLAGFQQHGAKNADLHDFASDSVDLNPIAHADAILAQQDEPTEESHDEVFQRHR